MFGTLESIIAALTAALYTQADGAIAAMCAWAWGNLFGYVAGLCLGFVLLKGLLDDDLQAVVQKLFMLIVILSILAWLIKPGSGGCQVVEIKNDALAMRASVTELIAPGWGGDPGQSIQKTAQMMSKHMSTLIAAAGESLQPTHTGAGGAVSPPALTPAQLELKSKQPLACSEIGAPETAVYCR